MSDHWQDRLRGEGGFARTSLLYRPAGVTLVEILVVLVVVAGILGAGISMMGLLTQSHLKEETMRMTSAIQYTYSQAALNNTPYRLVIDLDNNQYYTEMSESRVVMREASQELDEGLLPEEVRQMEADRRSRRSDLFREEEDDPFGISRRVGYQRADDAVIEPRTLGNGIEFYSVHTANMARPVTRGRAAINFFPNGFQQQAIIILIEPESEAKFTLITEPLTGRVRLYSGERSSPDDFGQERTHVR